MGNYTKLRRKLNPSFCTLRKSAVAKTAADAAGRRERLPGSEPEQGVRPGAQARGAARRTTPPHSPTPPPPPAALRRRVLCTVLNKERSDKAPWDA